MSLSKLILLCCTLAAPTMAQMAVKCPPYQGSRPLASATVFDGPPSEKADLVPDETTGKGDRAVSTWEVGYLFQQGRNVFLVCHYPGLKPSADKTIQVEKKVDRCVFRAPGVRRPAELSCK